MHLSQGSVPIPITDLPHNKLTDHRLRATVIQMEKMFSLIYINVIEIESQQFYCYFWL